MSHTKGLTEVKELPCSKGGTMKFLLVDGTGIAVMCNKGWHLNGDIEPWERTEVALEISDAIREARCGNNEA